MCYNSAIGLTEFECVKLYMGGMCQTRLMKGGNRNGEQQFAISKEGKER
ncbi:hypothetical protein FACS1894125_5100 [Actinomycetota bacterium]|nr:hypothetical protein FACS1894125_5100 [Actinomycetota bacterium]